MKNRFLSLLIIPALLLVGCKGQKISEEKAKEIATKITANLEALEGSSFEMKTTLKGSSGKGSEKKSADVTYTLTQDAEENMKLKVKGDDGEDKLDYIIYVVKDKDYDTVAYIKEYNVETKEYSERVYTKVTDDDYSAQTSSYTINGLLPALIIAAFADPVKQMESDDFKEGESEEDGNTIKTEVRYYSTGEKNLTLECDRKIVKMAESSENKEDKEFNNEVKYSITYDNLVLKKLVATTKTNYGNSQTITGTLDIKKVNIELPKGWQDLIGK